MSDVSQNGTTILNLAPLSAHFAVPARPTHLNTTANPELFANFTQMDQLAKVRETVRARDMKIAVISNAYSKTPQEDKARGTIIATELNRVLSGSKALVYEYNISNGNWFSCLRKDPVVTHYIFVNFPPLDQYSDKTPQSEFFNPRSPRIIEAVVVRSGQWNLTSMPARARRTAYTPTHYLEMFLQLEGSDADVAAMALCHFALSPPVPYPADKAFWSLVPKVIQVQKDHGSLGLAILAREMAPKSHYPRVVLVKSFHSDCMEQLKSHLGKYTHIQSFNGVLLDGLDITTVTSIIQASSHPSKIQLVVRYIHPIQTVTDSEGLASRVPNIATPISPADRIHSLKVDQLKETLPIQLMVLGNILKLCKDLFKHLSTPPPLDGASRFTGKFRKTNSGNVVPSPIQRETSLLCVPQAAKSDVSGSCCDSFDGSDFSTDYMALSQSDKYVKRAFMPPDLFNNLPSSSSSSSVSGVSFPMSPVQPCSDKQYIVTMFTPEMDRKLVHLFLRQSGIYIVTVSLSAMIDDPQIQFENLSFWIRLVQGYVEPNGIKRIIIVVMKDTPEKEHVCLENLGKAIQELDYQNLYKNHGSPIVLFDLEKVRDSLDTLCHAISHCMELMMSRAFHMDKAFFKNVFQPFKFLNEVLCTISCSKEITMSADSMLFMLSTFKNTDLNYFDMLAAFSTASISLTQHLDSLLKPGFLIELLKKLSLETDAYKDSFTHSIPLVKGLPVVVSPWPVAQISAINSLLTMHQQTSILKWAERYELFYSLGYHQDHEVYFIPLLATEFQSEVTCDWPQGEDEDHWYSQPDVKVLYAKLNFCAIHHFFYLLIKEALKDVVDGMELHSVQKCYIKVGCTEAIVPVHVPEIAMDIRIYLKYHMLQNTVEFRTDAKNRQLYLFYAANHKLMTAFSQSKHRQIPGGYNKAVKFYIQSNAHDPVLLNSSLGKLCQLSNNPHVPDVDEELDHDLLLKMIPITDSLMKEWTTTDLEAKQKIPEECYFRWGRHLSSDTESWALVGSKLNLITRGDIDFYRNNPCRNGNGELVLDKWSKSNTLTYKDLTNTLRSVALETLADEIDSYFAATEV